MPVCIIISSKTNNILIKVFLSVDENGLLNYKHSVVLLNRSSNFAVVWEAGTGFTFHPFVNRDIFLRLHVKFF